MLAAVDRSSSYETTPSYFSISDFWHSFSDTSSLSIGDGVEDASMQIENKVSACHWSAKKDRVSISYGQVPSQNAALGRCCLLPLLPIPAIQPFPPLAIKGETLKRIQMDNDWCMCLGPWWHWAKGHLAQRLVFERNWQLDKLKIKQLTQSLAAEHGAVVF